MTEADLASFLDGFHEAGGTLTVTNIAGMSDGVTGQAEATDEWSIQWIGDFRITAAAPGAAQATDMNEAGQLTGERQEDGLPAAYSYSKETGFQTLQGCSTQAASASTMTG